ncbi:MAG: hypothetical protein M1813_000607, partial [Trichoglossum hirsutum]
MCPQRVHGTRVPTISPNYVSIGGPRYLGTGALAIPPATEIATEMSRLSRALKRLKGKLKQMKHKSTPSMSSATGVATFQPLQSGPKPSSGAHKKTSPTQLLAQGSHGLNSPSKVNTSTPQKPASLSGETGRADPPCEPVPQPTKAAPSARKISRPVSTFTEAALQPEPQPALNKSPKETLQSEPQRELPDAEEVEDRPVVPQAPEKVAQQPSSSGKAPAVDPQPQPARKPTVTIATKAKRQPTLEATPQTPKPISRLVLTSKPTVQTHAGLYSDFTPSAAAADQPAPKPTVTAPKTKHQPTPKATPQTPKPISRLVSTPKPTVQTHAGLYSDFTPSAAAADQPAPKPTVTTPKTKHQPTPKATPQTPKPISRLVSTPKPAVQTHAGLYS